MKLPVPLLVVLACIACCLPLLGLGGVAALLGAALGATALGLPAAAIVLAVVALALTLITLRGRAARPSPQPIEFIE